MLSLGLLSISVTTESKLFEYITARKVTELVCRNHERRQAERRAYGKAFKNTSEPKGSALPFRTDTKHSKEIDETDDKKVEEQLEAFEAEGKEWLNKWDGVQEWRKFCRRARKCGPLSPEAQQIESHCAVGERLIHRVNTEIFEHTIPGDPTNIHAVYILAGCLLRDIQDGLTRLKM